MLFDVQGVFLKVFLIMKRLGADLELYFFFASNKCVFGVLDLKMCACVF